MKINLIERIVIIVIGLIIMTVESHFTPTPGIGWVAGCVCLMLAGFLPKEDKTP